MVGARGIHHQLVTALGGIPRFHRPALIAQTQDLLAAETEERRKTVVLIVDEAHLLSVEQLEQLRLLTNTDMDSRSSLGLILLGQPTLRRRLKQGHFAALDQRIGLRFHLNGLPLDETASYIAHHLSLAGRGPPERDRALPQRILASGRLGVVHHLPQRGLAHVEVGGAARCPAVTFPDVSTLLTRINQWW
jgi:type II secretory pathway predicted ATPase ExeA